jgi:hypothetical protein
MSNQHLVHLIKYKQDGKYYCKTVILFADTLVELSLKIKQCIRKHESENYYGSLFTMSPNWYVTDKVGKVIASTAQDLKELIVKVI